MLNDISHRVVSPGQGSTLIYDGGCWSALLTEGQRARGRSGGGEREVMDSRFSIGHFDVRTLVPN